jgi:hypothetical protein
MSDTNPLPIRDPFVFLSINHLLGHGVQDR